MDSAAHAVRPGALFQHWKGGLYRVESIATREVDGVADVVYRPLADPRGRRWTRPLAGFVETVTGPDGDARPRFAAIPLPDDGALRAACAAVHVPTDLIDAALARYAEPQRVYHAAWHPNDLFDRARRSAIVLDRTQALALLFHDAVYVAGAQAGVNEHLSALLLRQATDGRDDVAPDEVDAACAIVHDTAAHHASDARARTVVALDLATLGDPPILFDTWTEMVWLEYRHLFSHEPDPKAAFMRRRRGVLASLLEAGRAQSAPAGWIDAFSANLERLERRAAAGG